MVDTSARRVLVWKLVSELEAGWRILVGIDFQRKGTAELKERLPVSSLTGGR